MLQLDFGSPNAFERAISPFEEMAAYEALWSEQGATFKTIADKFRQFPDTVPSELVPENVRTEFKEILKDIFTQYSVENFGVRVHGANEYPEKLRDAKHPIEILYYQGWWDLVNTRGVAVVGSRKVSEEGKRRTRKLVHCLVNDKFTIISGLAEGVDTEAHKTALKLGGNTIAVIGTPLSHFYPKQNSELQKFIRENYLLISQVPFKRYLDQDFRANRLFFPERNVTMSALSEATIIVEASDTSGTLTQARAALNQGRKLFILESCFQNSSISWPAKYEALGAIRVRDYQDIREHM
ncbi:DNA-processing protein DprA [Xenorhabdus griffiniae]|uniref:DNA-processing protein DprA n=1 Tax=Xenorhabdus griffiniae TaxID=351672 RepID=A0ABY9XMP7_9GAMM|nr:DNA-processing protein DprA [Xenorhabdus griffiniae]MBD1228316.1 DNA-protecting protein DprA [Xenorhabdus griffiniae]MBE8587753.1 DNA-protecting protein DprA [Xenorhabdus griffiniae]WMV74047.1 DNA-processing protein DprA [Xenorhabdus griffiniae]WNH03727.1 DNA-processing protein DprA [Xenorhabdus griffiniae]